MQEGKALFAVQYPCRRPHHLEMIEAVRFNPGQPASGSLDIVRLYGEGQEFCFNEPVISPCKLPPKHGGVLRPDTVKVIPLGRYLNGLFKILLVGVPADKGKLNTDRGVIIVVEIAEIFKGCGFIVRPRKLVIDVLKLNAL